MVLNNYDLDLEINNSCPSFVMLVKLVVQNYMYSYNYTQRF